MNRYIPLLTILLAPSASRGGEQTPIVAISSSGRISIQPNPAMVTFVPSASSTLDGAIKDTALSTAKGQAVAATMARAIPIPIVGPFAGPLVGAVVGKLHAAKPITGFSVGFLNGLSASMVLPAGQISFSIPSQYLGDGIPSLLRIKASTKDSTRIVRSLHLSVKASGGSFTPNEHNTKLLGTDQEVIPYHQEVQGGDTVLIPESPLKSGEYAVALLPPAQDVAAPVKTVWDFRVEAHAAALPSAELQTISLGQSPAQVVASFGKPEKIVKLGTKEIYYYKDLKMVFVNNKVTDIQ